jgi:integrase
VAFAIARARTLRSRGRSGLTLVFGSLGIWMKRGLERAAISKRGRRRIKLPADAVAMLRAHKVEQMHLDFSSGLARLRLRRSSSPRLRASRSRRIICPGIGAACAPRREFHSLRHTHASMLIASGVDILAVSRRLGHSRASTTLDVYGHVLDGGDDAAAKAIEGVLK